MNMTADRRLTLLVLVLEREWKSRLGVWTLVAPLKKHGLASSLVPVTLDGIGNMQKSWTRCVLALLLVLMLSMGCAGFEMRAHLATKTPYRVYSSDIPTETPPPSGCQLVYANFIARYALRVVDDA
jgi:hypothetical protein